MNKVIINGVEYAPIGKPRPLLADAKVGDWVEYETCSGNLIHGQIASINSVNVNIISQRHELCRNNIWLAIDGTSDVYGYRLIRKLDPSEVIVNIGCLKGTVTYAVSNDCFLLAKVHDPQHRACCIDMSMLDTATRELVESLLKAQEE